MVSQKLLNKNLLVYFALLVLFSIFFPNFVIFRLPALTSSYYELLAFYIFFSHVLLGGLFLVTFYLMKTNNENSWIRNGSWIFLATILFTLPTIMSLFLRPGDNNYLGLNLLPTLSSILGLIGFIILLIGAFKPSTSSLPTISWGEQPYWFRVGIWVSAIYLIISNLTAFVILATLHNNDNSILYTLRFGDIGLLKLLDSYLIPILSFNPNMSPEIVLIIFFLIGAAIGLLYNQIRNKGTTSY